MPGKPQKTHTRVVVIGGGIAGCSVLYHLTREGWIDVVLVERDELTSGSTWHAAAQVTQFGANQTLVALKRHSIELYRQLAADAAHPFSYHITGGMRLAHTRDQVDTYRHFTGMASGVGVEMEFIDAGEVGKRHPLLDTNGLPGAWWDPLDGDIDPAGITFALARKAREAGAEVYRFNPVEAITRKRNGEFVVHTRNGTITCEKVVNAAGYRVNEVGGMLGVRHPVVSMEHQYFLTDAMAAIGQLDFRLPVIRDPGADFYCRQEGDGLLVGVYEQNCRVFGMHGIAPDFTRALCPSDLERCMDNMEGIFARLPALAEAGIRTVVNGPITYSADGLPLVGPVPGIANAYCAVGLRAGIGEGGGHGKVLAQIMVHGECEWDAWCLDPRRFTQYADAGHTRGKAVEEYRNEFHYHLPHEYRPASRRARTTPLYPVLDAKNCAWGVVNGWERALFFKPDAEFVDQPGYRFTPAFDVVGAEVRALAETVGLMEVSGFNRYEISGAGAGDFLDRMVCGRIPKSAGKIILCYLLSEQGNVLSEATLLKLADDRYWYGSAAAAEWHDRDWLDLHKPAYVRVAELAGRYTLLVAAGPKSRELLHAVAPHGDWSNPAFPWLRARTVSIGDAQVMVMRVSFSGELAYELHVPNEHVCAVWQLLERAGKSFDLGLFGLYAAESMRMEKGYRNWKSDLITEYDPFESGLGRFVDLDKDDFIGKPALLARQKLGPRKRFVSLSVECATAAAHPGAPVFDGVRQLGSVTSGGYGFRVRKNLAFAFISPAHAEPGTPVEIGILGVRYPAVVVEPALYDPGNKRATG